MISFHRTCQIRKEQKPVSNSVFSLKLHSLLTIGPMLVTAVLLTDNIINESQSLRWKNITLLKLTRLKINT